MPNLHKIGFYQLPSGTKSAKLVRLPNGCAGEQIHFAGRKKLHAYIMCKISLAGTCQGTHSTAEEGGGGGLFFHGMGYFAAHLITQTHSRALIT